MQIHLQEILKRILYKFSLIADYVVETGSVTVGSDLWYYEKKASGNVKCWAWVSRTCSSWTAWGSIYYCNVAAISYPFVFEKEPVQHIDVTTGAGSYWDVNYTNTAKSVGIIQMCRNNTSGGSIPCRIHIQVNGKIISEE